MRVFVGYASVHGSTFGIAERIAEQLRGHGLDVELAAMAPPADPSTWDAAVLGSAIHSGHWLADAEAFVRRHRDVLLAQQTWLFSVSLVGDEGSAFPQRVATRLRRMRRRNESKALQAMITSVSPREHRYFAGAVERDHWGASGRAFFTALRGRYGDHRNWPAVAGWADHIAAELVRPQG